VPRFLVLYRASVSARQQMAGATPEQMKAGMDAWMAWAKRNQKIIVDLGAPLGGGRRIGSSPGTADDTITGYTIVDAPSTDAVVKAFQDHPHSHTPGDSSIEIIEAMAMPGT
jgi:hypothetical protein